MVKYYHIVSMLGLKTSADKREKAPAKGRKPTARGGAHAAHAAGLVAGMDKTYLKELAAMDTRMRLLEVAKLLFWRYGYGSVSVDDICSVAGVQKGSFYHFFESKGALVMAAMEEDWKRKGEELDRIFSPRLTPLEQLRGFVEKMLRDQRQWKVRCGRVVGVGYATIGSEMGLQEGVAAARVGGACNDMSCRMGLYMTRLVAEAQRLGMVPGDEAPEAVAKRMGMCFLGALLQARMFDDLSILENDLPVMLAPFIGADARELKEGV